jgi:hypothetical protein
VDLLNGSLAGMLAESEVRKIETMVAEVEGETGDGRVRELISEILV